MNLGTLFLLVWSVRLLTTWSMHSSSSPGVPAVSSKTSESPALGTTSPDVFSPSGLLHSTSLLAIKEQGHLCFRNFDQENLNSYLLRRSFGDLPVGVSGYTSEYILSFPRLWSLTIPVVCQSEEILSSLTKLQRRQLVTSLPLNLSFSFILWSFVNTCIIRISMYVCTSMYQYICVWMDIHPLVLGKYLHNQYIHVSVHPCIWIRTVPVHAPVGISTCIPWYNT